MASAVAICPVCGETVGVAPGALSDAIECSRCGSSFTSRDATLVDSEAASRAFTEATTLSRPAAANAPGQATLPEIPGHEVIEFIARGGMGVVLKARHLVLGRLVAVKLPLPQHLADPVSRERFLREARSAAHLRHPNICPIYEVSEALPHPYIVMAYIEGQTLRDWAKAHPPTPRDAARLVATLARAAEHAHQHGVVHRDIKPANVMMDAETGEPVLTDFGLAKELTETGSQVTEAGMVVGTPAYMAPEQAGARTGEIGPPTDVYALGAVLYDLLCSRPPFLGTRVAVLYSVQYQEPTPPRKLNPRIHRDLETICLKALAKAPADRYPTALALAEDLERFSAGEAILARREPLPSRLWRKARRRPSAALALLATLVSAGAVAYFAWQATTSHRASSLVQSFEAGLGRQDWTEADLAAMEATARSIGQAAPERGAAERQRLHQRVAACVAETLRHPELTEGDLDRVGRQIALLEKRGSPLAPGLRKAVETRLRAWAPVFELQPPFAGLHSVFAPTQVEAHGDTMRRAADADRPVLVSVVPSAGTVQLEAVFDPSWESACELGLVLNAHPWDGKGYDLLLRPASKPVPDGESGAPPAAQLSFADARKAGGEASQEILRHTTRLRRHPVSLSSIPAGPLRLLATRTGQRLTLQVNNLPPVVFEDIFPLGGTDAGRFALRWPRGVGLRRLSAFRQALPAQPSPLERGDELHGEGRLDEALAFYRRQAIAASEAPFRQEAQYKEALCLLGQKREDEAEAILSRLATEAGTQWPILAACQLWMMRVGKNQMDEAEAIFDTLSSRYRFAELAALIPDAQRAVLLDAYTRPSAGTGVYQHNPQRFRNLERAGAVQELLGASLDDRVWMDRARLHAYLGAGLDAKALLVARECLRLEEAWLRRGGEGSVCPFDETVEEYCWILRMAGDAKQALEEVNKWLGTAAEPTRTPYRALLVERARIHVAMDEWDKAEQDVDEFLRSPKANTASWYRFFSAACLVQGFLRERRGDAEGALAAWRRACTTPAACPDKLLYLSPAGVSPTEICNFAILGSLTGEIQEADVDALQRALATKAKDNPTAAAFATLRPPPSVYAAFRTAWRTPRGRDYARKIAYQQITFAERARIIPQLLLAQVCCEGAFGGTLTAEEEPVIHELAAGLCAALTQTGKLGAPQFLMLVAAWRGVTGFLGWGGVAASLEPGLRGPLAYVLGHRYLRLKRPDDAATFFRAALADAPPGSALHRLAQDRLKSSPGKAGD